MKKFLLNSKKGAFRLLAASWLGIALGISLKFALASFTLIPSLIIGVPIAIIISIKGNELIDNVWKKYIHE